MAAVQNFQTNYRNEILGGGEVSDCGGSQPDNSIQYMLYIYYIYNNNIINIILIILSDVALHTGGHQFEPGSIRAQLMIQAQHYTLSSSLAGKSD